MSYSDFTIHDLKTKFGLKFVEDQHLFSNVGSYDVPKDLQDRLDRYVPIALAIHTGKARSELIVSNILIELKLQMKRLSYFSGIDFTGLTDRTPNTTLFHASMHHLDGHEKQSD